MLLDYLTAAALAHEIRRDLVGARVQEVLQPDRLTTTLELYAGQRLYLTLTADPEREGLLLSGERARRGEGAAAPLTLVLRARLVGARLTAVSQPPHERVLVLGFQGAEILKLVAELTGRLANVIATDADGVVLAAARQVTPQMTRARTVMPGRPYEPPPAPPKAVPESVEAGALAAWLADAGTGPAWRVLVGRVRGVSPLLAREITFRAGGEARIGADRAGAADLSAAMRDLMALAATGAWQPSVARAPDGIEAYAPYLLTHLDGTPDHDDVRVERVVSVAHALARYEAQRVGSDAYRDARRGVASALAEARQLANRRLAALERQHVDEAAIQGLREAGDLILTFQTRIAPGQAELTATFDPDAPPVTVRLDPALTPVENAQAYYDRYKRKQRAAEQVPVRKAAARAQLATIEQLAVDLELAENRSEIDAVQDALIEAGLVSRPRRSRKASSSGVARPLSLQSSDGVTVLVGRNSRQNEIVTFKRAARGDLWLHARGVPGGHVIVKAAGRPVPERTLREAAGLAAYYSGLRDQALAEVIVTDVRHVRRLRGGGPGMVRYDHEETWVVEPRAPDKDEGGTMKAEG